MNTAPPYTIVPPRIPSGSVYFFTTDSGMEYEVRFARKESDLLSATIAFGVLNEEFEGEEYSATNKGEVFRVMATIVKIVETYVQEHPNIRVLEFSGEPSGKEKERTPNTRLRLYARYADRILNKEEWIVRTTGDKMIITRADREH